MTEQSVTNIRVVKLQDRLNDVSELAAGCFKFAIADCKTTVHKKLICGLVENMFIYAERREELAIEKTLESTND